VSDPVTQADAAAARVRLALLESIEEQVLRAPNGSALLRLAEAYAWTVAPDQPHGGLSEA
jgi:hypothetical protein